MQDLHLPLPTIDVVSLTSPTTSQGLSNDNERGRMALSWIPLRVHRARNDAAYLPVDASGDDDSERAPLDPHPHDEEGYPAPMLSAVRKRGSWERSELVVAAAALAFTLGTGVLLGHLTAPIRHFEAAYPALLPRTLPPPTDTDLHAISASLPTRRDPVPSTVHYVYGLAESLELPYFAYLAMRSALAVLKPQRVLFHCVYEPRGVWWDRVRGQVEVVRARNVTSVGVHDAPVVHVRGGRERRGKEGRGRGGR